MTRLFAPDIDQIISQIDSPNTIMCQEALAQLAKQRDRFAEITAAIERNF